MMSQQCKKTKCSTRRRPRSEWLPLELPESLRIIPGSRWNRVQRRLDQNIAFSPRNEKHPYLLKGLVQCGACAAAYVGDPCHGKFYYRCTARCKRLPTVREILLNETVKGAVADLLLRPEVILEPLRRLDEVEAQDRIRRERASREVEQEAKRLENEEQRLLDGYRTGIISAGQLAAQLEKLKTLQSALELRSSEPDGVGALPADTAEKVTDFCAEAARSLASFKDEDWRQLLRTIIAKVVFHGDRVTVHGQIPIEGTSTQSSTTKSFSLEAVPVRSP